MTTPSDSDVATSHPCPECRIPQRVVAKMGAVTHYERCVACERIRSIDKMIVAIYWIAAGTFTLVSAVTIVIFMMWPR